MAGFVEAGVKFSEAMQRATFEWRKAIQDAENEWEASMLGVSQEAETTMQEHAEVGRDPLIPTG